MIDAAGSPDSDGTFWMTTSEQPAGWTCRFVASAVVRTCLYPGFEAWKGEDEVAAVILAE